jgi:hydrogenase maturation protein HypF
VLALGGYFKATLCVTRGAEAYVSQHLGDTDNAATRRLLEEVLDHWLAVLGVEPRAIACDLHPDYPSRTLAERIAQQRGLPLIAVQHHHAHIAAVLAEHRCDEPVLGLALDGTGHGDDGGIWGGELLRVDGADSLRLSHLAPLALPGGEVAAREPWRMAAAALHALGRGAEIEQRTPGRPLAGALARMIARGVNCPTTPSMGRWFDAAAGLLGVCETASYEGQAAMLLEGLAARYLGPDATGDAAGRDPALGAWSFDAAGRLDLLPLLGALADERDAARGAARFHVTLAAALADWVQRHARAAGIGTVALGGGCFLNALLAGALARHLRAAGLRVLTASQVPPNDGGLSLGQCWVAQRRLAAGTDRKVPRRACAGADVSDSLQGPPRCA